MSNVLVSVLIPTRSRTTLLHRSVQSLLEKSADPSRVEIFVAYDQDDIGTENYLKQLEWQALIDRFGAKNQNLCCPIWGYGLLNNYYTAMAKQAQGQWLMIWNDDAVMLSQSWDQAIDCEKDFVGMLHMNTENFKSSLTLFPLIPRTWLDLFGEISKHQLNDSWIQDICHEAQAVRTIPVNVFHDRYDVTGNNLDTTYQRRFYGKKVYHHEDMRRIRSDWAQRLKQHREQIGACESKPHQI